MGDKIIDFDQIQKEYATCLLDTTRVYMIENYLKTLDATQGREVPFKLFPRQKDVCSYLGSARNIVTTKPRQAGITTVCGGFLACEIAVAEKGKPITVVCVGNNLQLAQLMLFKIRDFANQLPAWAWGDSDLLEKCEDITEPVPFKYLYRKCNEHYLEFFNGSNVYARSSGKNATRGVGGVTWLIFDEAAFIENGRDVYTSAVPLVSTGGHIVMISTPNGKDALYYETCKRAKHKGTSDWNNFELIQLEWYQDPRYNKNLRWVKKDAETGEMTVELEPVIDTDGNIAWNPEGWEKRRKEGWEPVSAWYTMMCQQFNNDTVKIAQELDVSFLGSANNVVAPEFIEMQEKENVQEPNPQLKDPLVEDTWFWKPPIEGHRYIQSIDCSRGDADDRTAIEIIDIDGVDENGHQIVEQVAEYHGKMTGDDIGEIAYRYGRLYGNAFTVVDCIGGTGDACILTMMRLGYTNLYKDDHRLSRYMMKQEATTLDSNEDGKLPGFHTQSVRFQMLSNFANLVRTNAFKIRSFRVTNELDTWIYKGQARRIDHMDGFHDDTLTCLAMGLFIMEWEFNSLEKARKVDKSNMLAFLVGNSVTPAQNQLNKPHIQSSQTKKFPMPIIGGNSGKTFETDSNPYGWLLK